MSSSERPSGGTQALGDALPREVSYRRFRVQVTAGPEGVGDELVSAGSELSIGTAEGNQLVVRDSTVSRHHCSITVGNDGFLIRDLGSTNGTLVAGYRVVAAYLRSGAPITVGRTNLRFDVLDQQLTEPLSEEDHYGRALGRSAAMRRIFALLPRLGASESTVLIEGETGTGKGLIAEAIHASSPRKNGPFVVVDCGSIPPTLIESELFGHVRGAFTGAHGTRAGAFEAANGGTVFLDEVGELALEMQPKLLRALEERTIKRVGSVDPVRLDVRVVAATHRDLRQEVNRGSFRADLYYRLNTVRLSVPPLRERREDIPLYVAHFYEQFAPHPDARPPAGLVDALSRQHWPGNVRELRSAVERAVLMGEVEAGDEEESLSHPSFGHTTFDPALSFRAAKERAVAAWERIYLRELIREGGGNLSRAARAAKMDRNHLRELLQRHKVPVHED